MPTNDTSGPLFTASSPSAALQQSLESRLRARMDLNGSPEFALIWKTQDMPAGPQICALRGRARRISGSGFSGWPTARANDAEKRGNIAADPRNGLVGAVLHGWPTPSASEFAAKDLDRLNARRAAAKQIGLAMEARLLGWATPRARDGKGNGVSIARAAQGVADSLDLQCKTVSRNGTGATVAVERADGWARIAAEPALFPVAARIPGDVGRLRGSGNAIVPQVAAQFIGAVMECRP